MGNAHQLQHIGKQQNQDSIQYVPKAANRLPTSMQYNNYANFAEINKTSPEYFDEQLLTTEEFS